MLSGAAVMLAQRRAWLAVTTLGALVGLGGLLILSQYLVGADFGINHQLLFGRTWGQDTTVTPGRVGPPASSSFALIGTALVLLGSAARRPTLVHLRRFVPAIGVAVCGIMAFSLLGYVFGADRFYTIPWLTAIALPTTTMLFSLGASLVLSVPERDPMLLLAERSGAGSLARIIIPALALVIPLVLWLRIQGDERGYYDIGTGRALGALTLIVATIGIVWVALMALRRHEHALEAANRRKDEFVATLAHELRNPLAPLRNAIELQRLGAGDAKKIEAAREMMDRQVRHMTRLIDDLLDMSRITSGRLQLRKNRVALAEVLSVAVETAHPLIEAEGHQLTIQIAPGSLYVQADAMRLSQIFANLLNNAAKYTSKRGHIWLTAEARQDEAVVIVRDSGIGIAKTDLPLIFGLFTQVTPVLERTQGGLGIGLALAKGLVELHGGMIEASSAGPGKGSEFVVRLPLALGNEDSETQTLVQEDQALPVARRRIVVVDDLKDAADSLAMMLQMMGHDVQTAYDGVEAVQAVAAFKPDVVVLDIGLPKMNGYEAARNIRAQPHGKTTTLVALTGWGQEQDRRRAAEAGFDHHLSKPVDPKIIESLLAGLGETRAA
jgi:signal transduction histidine kinase/CheY-like chemotaxis protein